MAPSIKTIANDPTKSLKLSTITDKVCSARIYAHTLTFIVYIRWMHVSVTQGPMMQHDSRLALVYMQLQIPRRKASHLQSLIPQGELRWGQTTPLSPVFFARLTPFLTSIWIWKGESETQLCNYIISNSISRTCASLKAAKIHMSAEELPALLWSGNWPGDDYDSDDELCGLFRSYYLVCVSGVPPYHDIIYWAILGWTAYIFRSISCPRWRRTRNTFVQCNIAWHDLSWGCTHCIYLCPGKSCSPILSYSHMIWCIQGSLCYLVEELVEWKKWRVQLRQFLSTRWKLDQQPCRHSMEGRPSQMVEQVSY